MTKEEIDFIEKTCIKAKNLILEMEAELSRLQAENDELVSDCNDKRKELDNMARDNGYLLNQLRTAEQRVARGCCEIVDRKEADCVYSGDCNPVAIRKEIKQKYHIED